VEDRPDKPPCRVVCSAVTLLISGLVMFCADAYLWSIGHSGALPIAIVGFLLLVPGCYSTFSVYGAYQGWRGYDELDGLDGAA
jgi:hypothetical protein